MNDDAARAPDDERTPAAERAPDGQGAPARRLRSDDLFAGAREIVIEHRGRTYRMRITANGKLLLTA